MVETHGSLKVVTKNNAVFLSYRDRIYLAERCNVNTRALEELYNMLEDDETLTIYSGNIRAWAIFYKKFEDGPLAIKLEVVNEETLELARRFLKKLKEETEVKNGLINL